MFIRLATVGKEIETDHRLLTWVESESFLEPERFEVLGVRIIQVEGRLEEVAAVGPDGERNLSKGQLVRLKQLN